MVHSGIINQITPCQVEPPAAMAVVVQSAIAQQGKTELQAAKQQLEISFEMAARNYEMLAQVVQAILIFGEDYGTVPGIENPFLWKTGAQKLCNFFGLVPDASMQNAVENWAEPALFHYRFNCTLRKDGVTVGNGTGSCNSREDKFRYVWKAATKPADKAEEGRMKALKIGRNHKKFDGSWEWQEKFEVPNIYDQVHNIMQRAKKRAIVDAVNWAFAAAGFFSGQFEDFVEEEDAHGDERGQHKPAQADGVTTQDHFWDAVQSAGLSRSDPRICALAKRGALKELTWDKAIEQIKQPVASAAA